MKTKLIIAAIACLGLAACQQQSEAPKEEKATEHAMPAQHAPEHAAPAEHPAAPAAEHPAAPAQPAVPGTSYYDNNQNQNLAEQSNPAIDSQQQTAQTPDSTDSQEND